jgi:hypothetical protein
MLVTQRSRRSTSCLTSSQFNAQKRNLRGDEGKKEEKTFVDRSLREERMKKRLVALPIHMLWVPQNIAQA